MKTEQCLCRETCDTDQCQEETMQLSDGRPVCKVSNNLTSSHKLQ